MVHPLGEPFTRVENVIICLLFTILQRIHQINMKKNHYNDKMVNIINYILLFVISSKMEMGNN